MIPNPQEQVSIIRNLTQQYPLRVGEDQAYIISNTWLTMWKQIVGYDQISDQNISENKEIKYHKIGPIDNNDIAVNENELDPTKREETDFTILSPEVWNQLLHWFGGGPQISVPVYLNSNKQPTAIIHRFYIFCKFQNEDNVPFSVFNLMQLEELSKMVRKRFKIPDDIQIRFLEIDGKRALDFNNTIYGNELHPNIKLIIDYRRITPKNSEKWASENGFNDTIFFNTSKDRSDQESNDEEEDSSQNIYDEGDSEYTIKVPGICGLRNMGNSCYFNSALQCLMHCVEFIRYFLNPTSTKDWHKSINMDNPAGSKGEIVTSFVNLVNDIWSGKYVAVKPIKLKESIDKFTSQFKGTQQQDAHELITFLLDGIHEDLNNISTNTYQSPLHPKSRNFSSHMSMMNSNGLIPEEVISSNETWNNYRIKNNSIIVDMFQGLLRSQIVCPFCHEMTVVFDPYMTLSLPLARQHAQTTTVIFVPFDFRQQYKKFTITYSKSEQIYELIQQKVGYRVNFIFTFRQRAGSDTSFYWGFQNSGPNIDLFALEIPFSKSETAEINQQKMQMQQQQQQQMQQMQQGFEAKEIGQFGQPRFISQSQQQPFQFSGFQPIQQFHPQQQIQMQIQQQPGQVQHVVQVPIQQQPQFLRVQQAPSIQQLQQPQIIGQIHSPQMMGQMQLQQTHSMGHLPPQIQQPPPHAIGQMQQIPPQIQVAPIQQTHSLNQMTQQQIPPPQMQPPQMHQIYQIQQAIPPQMQHISPIHQMQVAPMQQMQIQPQQPPPPPMQQMQQGIPPIHQQVSQLPPQMQRPPPQFQQIQHNPQMIPQPPYQFQPQPPQPQPQPQQQQQQQNQQQQSGFHLYGGSPDYADSGPAPLLRPPQNNQPQSEPSTQQHQQQQQPEEEEKEPVYIACVLRVKIHKNTPISPDPILVVKDASAPFLVPVDDFKITREELNSQLERYFEFAWSDDPHQTHENDKLDSPASSSKSKSRSKSPPSSETELSIDEIKDFLKDAVYDVDETELDFTQYRKSGEANPGRVMVQFPSEYYIINGENRYFKENPVFHRVSHIFYSVYVNKDSMKKGQHFHYQSIFSHVQFVNVISSRICTSEAISLHKCFKFFSENEILDSRNQWFCKKCQKNVNANKKIDVWSAPKVLIIQLKRFVSFDDTLKKLDTNIAYPELLDMSDYLVGPEKNRKSIYKLFAVCEHFGGLMGGHYTAHALATSMAAMKGQEKIKSNNYENGKWYYFNDSSVTRSSSHEAHTHNAYMLFYEKID